MIAFNRQHYGQLWITLLPSQPLDPAGGYVQDGAGNPGRVTLRHARTGTAYDVPVSFLQPSPGNPYGALRGWLDLAGVPAGGFALECRCRDLAGNEAAGALSLWVGQPCPRGLYPSGWRWRRYWRDSLPA